MSLYVLIVSQTKELSACVTGHVVVKRGSSGQLESKYASICPLFKLLLVLENIFGDLPVAHGHSLSIAFV